jgi:pimeloyl-ACP methyl ester carboxylesterase
VRDWLFLIAFVAFFSHVSVAETASPKCSDSNVASIQRPIYPGQRDSRGFEYKFRFFRPSSFDQPVVIFLPGGPGGTSMKQGRDEMGVPASIGYVATDPRGVGCNKLASFDPARFYTTRNLATDVVALVSWLQSAGYKNYILFGQSYGTILANVAASMIEAQDLVPPKAIVLSGVVAHAFQSDDQLIGFKNAWQTSKAKFSVQTQAALNTDRPLGFSSRDWGRFITMLLQYGVEPRFSATTPLLAQVLNKGLSFDASPANRKYLTDFMQIAAPEEADDGNDAQIYNYIACREIFYQRETPQLILEKGNLSQHFRASCRGFKVSHPYDSKNYLLSKTPIFYFSGGLDPDTPAEQPEEHFRLQTKTKRTIVRVPAGGHMTLNITLGDCAEKIFYSIVADGADFPDAVKSCAVSATAETLGPE